MRFIETVLALVSGQNNILMMMVIAMMLQAYDRPNPFNPFIDRNRTRAKKPKKPSNPITD